MKVYLILTQSSSSLKWLFARYILDLDNISPNPGWAFPAEIRINKKATHQKHFLLLYRCDLRLETESFSSLYLRCRCWNIGKSGVESSQVSSEVPRHVAAAIRWNRMRKPAGSRPPQTALLLFLRLSCDMQNFPYTAVLWRIFDHTMRYFHVPCKPWVSIACPYTTVVHYCYCIIN